MTAMLETLLSAVLLASAAGLAVVALGVLPFVVGVDLAERRGLSADWWGAVCLCGIAITIGLGYEVLTATYHWPWLLVIAAVAWVAPVGLRFATAGRPSPRRGAHLR